MWSDEKAPWLFTSVLRFGIDELIRRFDLYTLAQASLSAQDDATKSALDAYSRGLVKKLLHYPIMYLRQAVAQNTLRSEDLNLVLALYNLQEPAPAPQGNTDE